MSRLPESWKVPEKRQNRKENALAGAKSEIAGLAVEAARKMLAGGSQAGNSMLYDTFLAEAGDADDRESE